LSKTREQLINQKVFLDLLIGSIPDMIFTCDLKFNINVWNKKIETHTGIKEEEAIGKNLFEIFPEYNNNEWKTVLNDVLSGETKHYAQLKYLRQEGYGESFLIPLRNYDNDICGIIIITRDITELVNATITLRKKNEELERSNQELLSFSYVASHDLKEPLRKIQSFSSLIMEKERGKLSETTADYFNRIISASARMQKLIESLLEYSRMGTAELRFESVDLNEILEDVKSTLKEIIEQKNAVIENSGLPVFKAVPVQMQQLFLNLVSNSLKYSRTEAPPLIKLSAERIKSTDMISNGAFPFTEYWKINVADNGIGFEQKNEHKIFELFHRLHGKMEYGGTGIGLAICKRIVQNHEGIITAHGKPGEGSEFIVCLPVR
jgi:PAS domain S-box-containing protein